MPTSAQPAGEPIAIGPGPETRWTPLVAGLAAVFALFQAAATALESDRGQAGVPVALLVIAALILVERWIFGESTASAARRLGLGRPRPRGLAAALGICLLLLVAIGVVVRASGAGLTLSPGAGWLLPGLFAQGGVAEEVLFRGYLFGHLRRRRSFWRACLASMGPFVAVHLWLFVTMPWPIAAASLVLSAIVTIPLARLFELGGWTIWAPALLHFVIQSVPKIVSVTGNAASMFPVAWIAVSGVVPLLILSVEPARAEPQAPDGHAPAP